MTYEEWWTTPFMHKASVPTVWADEAEAWLEQRGYRQWHDWNRMFLGTTTRFEFLSAEVHMLFQLRWG